MRCCKKKLKTDFHQTILSTIYTPLWCFLIFDSKNRAWRHSTHVSTGCFIIQAQDFLVMDDNPLNSLVL